MVAAPPPTAQQPQNGAANEFPEVAGMEISKQIETLNNMLELEVRIRDGAENMIEARSSGPALLRQVESELASAKAKIAAITKKLELLKEQSGGGTRVIRKKPTGLLNGPADLNATKRALGPSLTTNLNGKAKDDGEKDDYKTAISHATSYVRTLASMPRTFGPRSPPPTGVPSPIPSISSAASIPGFDGDIDRTRADLIHSLVTVMQRNIRVRYELDIVELIKAVVPALSDHATTESRAAGYRLLRYAMFHPNGPKKFMEQDLDLYLVRSLSRDNKHLAEKEQAFLLIRTFTDVGSERRPPNVPAGCATVPLREPVVRAVVAIAEHEEDPFRSVALELLTEILLLDIDLVYRCEAMKVLLQSLSDGPPELAPVLAMAFLTITDSPRTRAYLHPGTDLEMGLSGITDAYGRGEVHMENMKASARVVITMLRSWSGLMYLCMDDMLAIRTLVDTLRVPSLELREVILDMFFEVLNIKPPNWYQAFLTGRRLTMYGRQKTAATQQETVEVSRGSDRLTLVDQYIALLLVVFTDAGLIDALISTVQEPTAASTLSRKATLLIGEILEIANRLLPLPYAARIQALSKLFNLATDYQKGDARKVGTSTLSSIDSFNRNRSRLQPSPVKDVRSRADSVDDPMRRGQRQIEQVKLKIAMQLDDRSFQQLMTDSKVMQEKEHNRWNYECLVELFEGPLLNPKRLEEAIRAKWVKKVIAFFHPSARRFSDMKRTHSNIKWVKFGCHVLSTLSKSPEGQRFLHSEDIFLEDLAKSLSQLDPWNNMTPYDSIFSKQRVEDTLSYGYLEMLGALSKTQRGIELMEHFKFFTAFYHLSDLKFREDLLKCIIENLDYTVDGHSRIVLSKALTSTYKHIRLYATQHLGRLILNSKQANSWTLRLLLTQLYDPSTDVREMAVNFLEEACESRDILQMVVEIQPTLDHLGELGHPLLLKFMSTTAGFHYLHQTEYIEREMNAWFHERNSQYVVLVEVYLAKAFSTDPAEDGDDIITFDGIAPPHFYGEMVKTELGCQVLHDKGHFSDFTHFIRQHGLDSEDSDIILKLKSFLWAVGNIGASERGVPFLEDDEIIPMILDIAEQSPVLSVRGTCFFALGLIASTPQGAEILSDYGWIATTTPLGSATGVCIPEDIAKFMMIPRWETPLITDKDRRLPPLKSQLERHVLETIESLCNTVISQAASRTLSKLKSKPDTRHVFSSLPLFHRTLHTISNRRYRLPARKYILDLFDIRLDSSTLEELARLTRAADEELKATGGLVINVPSLASKRKARQSMAAAGRPRSRRKSTTEGDEDSQAWLAAQEEKEMVIKVKPSIRVVGFDDGSAPPQDSAGGALGFEV